ncbi:MAG: EF-hand domain-containing protein [Alphaproteobacteria bacterium]|nr:MAG: EF-hand domain-containing protein [Alphaproteobacteria bacterium]
MKTPSLLGLTGLLLLVPAAACGQTRQQPQPSASVSRSGAGVTLQEFTARRERRMLSADTDGDGKVSRAEFLASAKSDKGDPSRRFGRVDRNRDGMIDKQEIAAIMARRFNSLDTDRNGVLTPAERTAARAEDQGGPES